MAQGTILLPISGITPNADTPCALNFEKSRGKALFDDTTEERGGWYFRMPSDYNPASPIDLIIQWAMASATTGSVVMSGYVMAVTPADAVDIDTDSFDTANSAQATVPAVAGRLAEQSITLLNKDNLAAGDYAHFCIQREATDVNDTASGDLELVAASLEYTIVEA